MAFTDIDNPELHFQIKTYTGNGTAIGSGGQAITLDGEKDMQPDWVWIKDRSDSDRPRIFDVVRGVTKELDTTDTTGETTLTEGLTAFGSNGFTVGNHEGVNSSGDNFVAWCWKAGGSASSNSDGSISSSVSANQTAGFSVLTFTGTQNVGTVGHGLGSTPGAFIIKNTADSSDAWYVYHKGLASDPQTDYIILNTNAAKVDYNTPWNDTAPTSSVFTVGADGGNNENTSTMVAYCFAEKQGYSKIGAYVGNGNANGPFIHCGFRPAWIMVKCSSATQNWQINDAARGGAIDNPTHHLLLPSTSDAEAISIGSYACDFVSNGFKIRNTLGQQNTNGETYIYIAFAEAPFVNSNGVPCNAR